MRGLSDLRIAVFSKHDIILSKA